MAETWLEYEAWRERTDDEHDRDLVQAWQGVRIYLHALSRKGRMPKLETLLRRRGKPVQSAKQIGSVLKVLARQYPRAATKAAK